MNRVFVLLAVTAVALTLGAGCASNGEEEVVLGEPRVEEEQDSEQDQEEETVGWNDLTTDAVGDADTRPRFIPAEDARTSPKLTLQNFGGEKRRVQPGHPDRVTVVVFWSLDSQANLAAVLHLDRLVNRYYRMGVRGINVVEKAPTDSHRAAPRFLNQQGVGMTSYYDDFSALRRMAKAGRARVKKEVPCIFMVDRQMRVRFFKRGFSFAGTSTEGPRGGRARIVENAPSGQRIEDFLRKLLEER